MSWARFILFGSGLIFSTGLVWFFVQAWVFAIQARTVWLIILLTITTAVAIVSQGYLCTIFVSISPDPKPRGVTQVNREAFASFPFDATASLVRRKSSTTRPSIGWEVKSTQQLAPSFVQPEPEARSTTPLAIEDADGTCESGVLVGERRRPPLGDGAEGRKLRTVARETEKVDDPEWGETSGIRSPKNGPPLQMVPSAISLMTRNVGWGGFERARIASSDAGGKENITAVGLYVEDVVESGRASLLLPDIPKIELLGPPGPGGYEAQEKVRGIRVKEGILGESLENSKDSSAAEHHRHCRHHYHHLGQEMKRCCSWTASGHTDATSVGFDDEDPKDTKDALTGVVRGGGQSSHACRSRCRSLGSSIDCGGQTAVTDCTTGAKGKELMDLEQQARKAAGVQLPLAGQKTAVLMAPDAGRCVHRGEEPVVRVSELPDVCAICLGQYATGEEVHVLPCLHIFHAECLDVWITRHPSCPYCKGDLNVIPQESNVPAETSATTYTCSVLSGLAFFVTWVFAHLRGLWERRQQGRQRDGERER